MGEPLEASESLSLHYTAVKSIRDPEKRCRLTPRLSSPDQCCVLLGLVCLGLLSTSTSHASSLSTCLSSYPDQPKLCSPNRAADSWHLTWGLNHWAVLFVPAPENSACIQTLGCFRARFEFCQTV